MMAIGIDDGDAFDSVFVADVLDHDRFHVQGTETTAAMDDAHGMVSAWTNQSESVIHLTVQHLVGSGQRSAHRNQMGRMNDLVDIRNTEMHAVDIGRSRQIRLIFLDIVEVKKTFLDNLILCVKKTFFTFRMGRRNRVVKRREKNQSCLLFHESLFQFDSS